MTLEVDQDTQVEQAHGRIVLVGAERSEERGHATRSFAFQVGPALDHEVDQLAVARDLRARVVREIAGKMLVAWPQ